MNLSNTPEDSHISKPPNKGSAIKSPKSLSRIPSLKSPVSTPTTTPSRSIRLSASFSNSPLSPTKVSPRSKNVGSLSTTPNSPSYSPSFIPKPKSVTRIPGPSTVNNMTSTTAATGEYQRLMASKNNSLSNPDNNSRSATSSYLNSNLRTRRKNSAAPEQQQQQSNSTTNASERSYLNKPITSPSQAPTVAHEGYSSYLNSTSSRNPSGMSVPASSTSSVSSSVSSAARASSSATQNANRRTNMQSISTNSSAPPEPRRMTSITGRRGTTSGVTSAAENVRTARRATHVSNPGATSTSVPKSTTTAGTSMAQRRYNPNLRTITTSTNEPSGAKMANITYNVNSNGPRTVHAKLEVSESNDSTTSASSASKPGTTTTVVPKPKVVGRREVSGTSSIANPPLPSSRRNSFVQQNQQTPAAQRVVGDKKPSTLLTSVTAIRTKSSLSSSGTANGGSSYNSKAPSRNSSAQPSPRPPKLGTKPSWGLNKDNAKQSNESNLSKGPMTSSVKPSTTTAYNASINSGAATSVSQLRKDLSQKLGVAPSPSAKVTASAAQSGEFVPLSSSKMVSGSNKPTVSSGLPPKYSQRLTQQGPYTTTVSSSVSKPASAVKTGSGGVVTGQAVYRTSASMNQAPVLSGRIDQPPPIPMQTHPMMAMQSNTKQQVPASYQARQQQQQPQVQIHFPTGSKNLSSGPVSATIPTSTAHVGLTPGVNNSSAAYQISGALNAHSTQMSTPQQYRQQQQITSTPISPSIPQAMPAKTPQEVLKRHGNMLTTFERGEILEYPHIYFIGQPKSKPQLTGNTKEANTGQSNYGFDDERGDYLVRLNDHLLYRYELIKVLGKGSFGQVLRARDHKTGEVMAIKIIRNRKRFHHQALVEVKLLECLRRWDTDNSHHLLQMTDHFYFRNHLCIVTELLSINLYEWLKANQFAGTPNILLRHMSRQILSSLELMSQHRIIHCDLKPENILLSSRPPQLSDHNQQQQRSSSAAASYHHQRNQQPRQPHPLSHNQLVRDIERGLYNIKVIDFGSSCFETERVYTYIQSRFYRSPEVILGHAYSTGIDMWSLGCIVAELLTGFPLFPGENEREQLACIMEVLGPPPGYMIERAPRRDEFADDARKVMPNGVNNNLPAYQQQNAYIPGASGGGFRVGNWVMKPYTNSKGKRRKVGSRPLSQVLARARDPRLVDFVMRALAWDPGNRLTPKEAALHPWILDQQPQPIQMQVPMNNAGGNVNGLTRNNSAYVRHHHHQQQPQQQQLHRQQ